MTSIVCQGLQSCLEPRLIEPRILRPKLTSPKSNNTPQQNNPQTDQQDNEMYTNKNGEELGGGWSFIKALTNTPQNSKPVVTETEKVYVHPLAKSSSSSLSKKSLEMCTEGLGSETGSDISESSSDEFSSVINIDKSSSYPTIPRRELGGVRKLRGRGGGGGNFPPPLTSISGSESVRVRPVQREGGRLVIEAVTVASCCNGYFQAERGGGRLRLCLMLKDSSVIRHNDDEDNDVDGDCDDVDGASEEGSDDDVKWDEGAEDNNGNVGGEIANIVELPSCSSRPISRCIKKKNNNNEWGQFLVAAINS